MKTYTIHHRQSDPQAILGDPDRLEVVKEGFCWPAFFIPFIWLIYRRMWIVLLLYIAASMALGAAANILALPPVVGFLMGLGMNLIMGFEGNDLLRWSLARRGIREVDVVTGSDISDAEHRFFRKLTGETDRIAAPERHRPTPGHTSAVGSAGSTFDILPEPGRTP